MNHKNLITASKFEYLLQDMQFLHMCSSENEYKAASVQLEILYAKDRASIFAHINKE